MALECTSQSYLSLVWTATANMCVEEDILQQVDVAQVIRGTMQRPNLSLNVVKVQGDQEKLCYLAHMISRWSGTGVIYTATRVGAEMVAMFLSRQGIDAVYYHAGVEAHLQQDIEYQWSSSSYKVVCSANAGIDKPDICFVVHYNIPASPMHYYQEIGRAGRSGNIAHCVLLYDPADLSTQEYFIQCAKVGRNYYDSVLTHVRVSPLGMYDLMRATGFSQKVVQIVLADLEKRGFIEYNARDNQYHACERLEDVDLSVNDAIRLQKERELLDIQSYATTENCYMGYLTAYLEDQDGYLCGTCGRCRQEKLLLPTERIQEAVTQFLSEEFLPCIERHGSETCPIHEAGWSLSYDGNSHVGELVRLSKDQGAGPFAKELIVRSTNVIRARYPIDVIDAIVSVPPTKSGKLVETFARKVADMLHVRYLPVLTKVRPTEEQKNCTNWLQKADNVKSAFSVSSSELVRERTLLLIDDTYDSGYMLREVGRTLVQAGARAVYPFTITRTLHSDDQ